MGSAYDLVSFVTRSENRVRALRALEGEPMTRPELQAETGVARPTLSRILADGRERRLVTRSGHQYALTPLGAFLAGELGELFDAVEATRARQRVARWLPLEDLGVDFAHLAAADVTLPTPVDPLAPVTAAATALEGAGLVRGFCYSLLHAPILAECRNVTEGGNRFVGVVAADVLAVVAEDPELAGRVRDLAADANARLYVTDERIEPQLVIADGTTLFLVAGEGGAIQGLVAIDDETVLPWAASRFEAIRARAEPLDPDRLDEVLAA